MDGSDRPGAFRVLPITLDHVSGFRAAVDSVARERRYLALLEAPPLEDATEFVRQNLDRGNPQLIAEAGGAVIGWCDIIRNGRPIHAHMGVLGTGVVAEWRGRGVGTALMRAALDQARASGFSRVELTVRESNQVAIALYIRLGFVIEGVHRNAVLVDGVYENMLSMALLFEAPA
jgi:ribosomal protein S18 acetylase RimI-like enzyme